MPETSIHIPVLAQGRLRAVMFGMAVHTLFPRTIEVKVAENGKSVDITPWNKDEKTNCVWQMEKSIALELADALTKVASTLPDPE